MSPASGDLTIVKQNDGFRDAVSIQLMSPASGDLYLKNAKYSEFNLLISFHSINVPSEWGLIGNGHIFFILGLSYCFHSINVPSEWGRKVLVFIH